MKKIILIIGLPGSGKSHYAKTLGFPVYDDIKELSELPDTDSDSFVVVDAHFCRKRSLDKAIEHLNSKYSNHDIECIYFEFDPQQCYINAKYRNDGRSVFGDIKSFAKDYIIPEGSKVIEVYRG